VSRHSGAMAGTPLEPQTTLQPMEQTPTPPPLPSPITARKARVPVTSSRTTALT